MFLCAGKECMRCRAWAAMLLPKQFCLEMPKCPRDVQAGLLETPEEGWNSYITAQSQQAKPCAQAHQEPH